MISAALLNRAYELQLRGRPWSDIYWAGQNIQILKESIVNIAKRNELLKIRNVTEKVAEFILQKIDKI